MKKSLTLLISLPMVLSLSSCMPDIVYRNRMLPYYENDKNYVEVIGRIEKIRLSTFDDVYIRLFREEENHTDIKSYSSIFYLTSWHSVECDLVVGDIITYTTAYRVFYDGYVPPIVGIERDGVILLPFEQGKENYISWIKETFK